MEKTSKKAPILSYQLQAPHELKLKGLVGVLDCGFWAWRAPSPVAVTLGWKDHGTDDQVVPGWMELFGSGSLRKMPHDSAWHVRCGGSILRGQGVWQVLCSKHTMGIPCPINCNWIAYQSEYLPINQILIHLEKIKFDGI